MRKILLLTCLTIPLILSILGVNMTRVTAAETHDIAVISVTPSLTVVEIGNIVNITVLVENQGDFTETFSLNCTYDDALIDTQTNINLTSGESKNVTFSWDTAELWNWADPYELKAVASIVSGETDTTDNTLASPNRVRAYEPQYVAVVPHSTVNPNLTIGTSYTVSIYTDYNGSDITGWQFDLSYNPHVLQGVNIVIGDLISNATHPGKAMFIPGTFNNVAGKLSLTSAWLWFIEEPAPLTSGPGTLANVTFEVVGLGDSPITLGEENTKLIGYTEDGYGDSYDIIDRYAPDVFHILHGFFQNEKVIHDVAVISVTAHPTSVVSGEPMNITVVIKNQGNSTETVTVKVHYDYEKGLYEPLGTKTEPGIAPGASANLTFTWETRYVLLGNHTITAIANQLPGETDIEDNICHMIGKVTITELKEQPIPIELVIGVAAIVVAVIVVGVFLLRRGKKPIPE